MNTATPAHDFLKQGLSALVAESASRGIERDVAVAVLTDLITASDFNHAAPDPAADSAPLPPNQPGPPDEVLMVQQKNALLERSIDATGYY